MLTGGNICNYKNGFPGRKKGSANKKRFNCGTLPELRPHLKQFRCSDNFKKILESVAKHQHRSEADILHEALAKYAITSLACTRTPGMLEMCQNLSY